MSKARTAERLLETLTGFPGGVGKLAEEARVSRQTLWRTYTSSGDRAVNVPYKTIQRIVSAFHRAGRKDVTEMALVRLWLLDRTIPREEV